MTVMSLVVVVTPRTGERNLFKLSQSPEIVLQS